MAGLAAASRKSLWDRMWIRLPVYLVLSPLIILIMDAAIGTVYILVIGSDVSNIPANLALIAILAVMQLAPLIVPLILVELGNRIRGWPIPARICALFVAVFALALAGIAYGSARLINMIPNSDSFTGGASFMVIFLLGCCVVAGVVSWALTSPLIRRWAQRHASASDLAEHF